MNPDLHQKRVYFNELAARWDSIPVPPDTPQKVARCASRCVEPASRAILDVGCGTGILLPFMPAGARVVELDVAESMLLENRRKGPASSVRYVCGAAQRLPFPPAAFDTIVCFNALPHLNPIEATLAELLGCLQPSGLLSVGHIMSSRVLNDFHASLGGAVGDDRLPSASDLAAALEALGASVFTCCDEPDQYLVQARK